MTTCLIYCRVSHDQAGGRSVAEQELENRQAAARLGWEVVGVETDNSVGASRYSVGQRTAWARVIAQLPQVDALVVWEASRSTRDLAAYLELRKLCREHGVLYCYNAKVYDLSRSDDSFMTGLDILLAEKEVDQARERILRSVRANAASGRPHGRMLYGYRRTYSPVTGALISQDICEPEAAVLREAAERFLAGEPCLRIANDFNARGISTQMGKQWNVGQVRRYLVNPSYIAKRIHRGKVVGDAIWPPIFDEATFYAITTRFADRSRVQVKDKRRKYLLSSIATCGVCGSPVKCYAPRGYPAYTCPKFCTARKMTGVDELVTKLVLGRLALPDARAIFTPDPTPEVSADIAERRNRLEGFYVSAAKGEITPQALGAIERSLLDEIATLEQRQSRARLPEPIEALIHAEDIQAAWDGLPIAFKRLVVQTLVTIVILPTRKARSFDPRSVAISWRTPGAELAPAA